MFGFGQLIEILKKNPKKIVLTEGTDPRILEASSRLLASNFLHPILITAYSSSSLFLFLIMLLTLSKATGI